MPYTLRFPFVCGQWPSERICVRDTTPRGLLREHEIALRRDNHQGYLTSN